jgi:hypothetical protein
MGVGMIKVYELSEELRRDPEQVKLAHALTLDPNKPYMGLKGNFGLFGSSEWWSNIRDGIIPTKRVSGIIQRVYVTGQDATTFPNTFDMITNEGCTRVEGIYVNNHEDIQKFKRGAAVDFVYAMDELKASSSQGEKNYSNIVLEMSISN